MAPAKQKAGDVGVIVSRSHRLAVALAALLAVLGTMSYAIGATAFTPPRWTVGAVSTDADLRSVAFTDATRGTAVGSDGALLLTEDGGASWRACESETTASLNGVTFATDGCGWVVGDSGVIRASIDGVSWTTRRSGVNADLLGVDFADATQGWAVGRGATVLSTDDGGSVWTTRTIGVSDTATLNGVAFPEPETGWVWGEGGVVARTTDAGSTWTTRSVAPKDVDLYAGAFLDARTGWVAGSAGLVSKTVDGGMTWTTQAVATTATIRAISFANAENGFLVGGDEAAGVIAGTADGGATWTVLEPQLPGTYRAVRFISASQGWIVGDGGAVLRTAAEVVETPALGATRPQAPAGVYARAVRSGAVLVVWPEPVSTTATVAYRVWRSVNGGDYAPVALVRAELGPRFSDTSAPNLATVAYKVSALGPADESSASAATTVTTEAATEAHGERPDRMSCVDCHPVHVGSAPSAGRVCLGCHPEVEERLSGEDAGTRHDLLPGDAAGRDTRISCADCHDPHSCARTAPVGDGAGSRDRLTGSSDASCLRCHDGDASARERDVHGELPGADPHLLPELGYTLGDTLECVDCHDPHGATNRWALLESVASKDGTRQVGPLLVVPLAGAGADLRHFCSGCHSLSSHPGPSAGGADLTAWPIDCTGCHSHGRGL